MNLEENAKPPESSGNHSMEYKSGGGGCEETMQEKDRRRNGGEKSRSVCLYYDIASKTQSYQLRKRTVEITAFKVSP